MNKIKTLLVAHGEKMVLGIVAIAVLAIVGMTNWVPYDKRPLELQTKIDKAEENLKKSVWPDTEKVELEELDKDDTRLLVKELYADIPYTEYSPTVDMMFPISGQEQPAREPVWLPVKNIHATAGIALLAQRKDIPTVGTPGLEETPEKAGSENDTTTPEDRKLEDMFKPRNGQLGVDLSGSGLPNIDNTSGETTDEAIASNTGSFSGEYSGEDPYGANLESNLDAKMYRYISIRGVVSRDEQIQKLKDALHVPYQTAEGLLQYVDFQVERQTANPEAADPWSGKWEKLDIGVALDVVNRAADLDADPVSEAIKDPVITMPLPSRMMGVWRSDADHPSIENFVLSDAEMEAELRLNNKLISAKREELEKEIAENPQVRGFGQLSYNLKNYQQDLFNSQNREAQQLLKELEEEIKAAGGDVEKLIRERIKSRVSAAGRLLLFRYIDFTVEPGKSYRYRVQLTIRNPNFDRPIEDVALPSVAEGLYRDTPVSEPSEVVTVQEDTKYFLAAANPPRGTSIDPSAYMSIYEWYNETATLVHDKIDVDIGELVGGTTKTHVVRPSKPQYEEEEVTLRGDDLLVDLSIDSKVDREFHSDLALPSKSFGSLGMEPLSLLVDRSGNFVEKDKTNSAREQSRMQKLYDLQDKSWNLFKDAIKNAAEATENSGLDASEYIDDEYSGDEMMEGINRYTKKRRNSNRRRATSSGSGETSVRTFSQ